MKTKIGIVVLVVACVGLVIALIAVKKGAGTQHITDTETITDFSNELVNAHEQINGLDQVNLVLSNQLDNSQETALTLSNNLIEASNTLATTETSFQNQITNLDDRIASLTAQNQVLDQRADSLSNTIETLNSQIADTEQKLANSETNNSFLTDELKRQMAEKAELERKFNDLAEVRDQVKKLRDELFVARRLQWMREGIDPANQPKGAELLVQQRPPPTNATPARNSYYDLNVEIGSDGSVHVIPPPTNPPPAATPPSFLH